MAREPGGHQETPWRSPEGFRIQPICGGAGLAGEISLVTRAITGVALCLGCITEKTGLPLGKVKAILDTIGKAVGVTNSTAPCDACLNTRDVYRLR